MEIDAAAVGTRVLMKSSDNTNVSFHCFSFNLFYFCLV